MCTQESKWPEQKTDHFSVWVWFRTHGPVSRYPHFIIVVLVGRSRNLTDLCFKVPSSNLRPNTRRPGSRFSWFSSFPSDEYQRCALIRPRSRGLLPFAIYHSIVYSAILTAFLSSPQTALFSDPWTVCNYYINSCNWINQLSITTLWWLDICCLLHRYQLYVSALMAIFRLIDWQQTCKQLYFGMRLVYGGGRVGVG